MKTKIFITLFFLIVFALISNSCGDEYIFASESQCEDCLDIKPTTGSLIINFTEQKSKDGVILKIYKGLYLENAVDNNLISQDTVTISPFYLDGVEVNETYSVEATYTVNNKKIKVIDGNEMKVNSIKATCNKDCWIYRGGEMDCNLKFEK